MPIKHIHYTFDFRKSYLKLPKHIRDQVDKKDALFRSNPKYPGLRAHKLSGPLADFWSFSINREYRVLFEFTKDGAIFYDVGTHDIYK